MRWRSDKCGRGITPTRLHARHAQMSPIPADSHRRTALFNHVVGDREHARWNGEAERPCGFEVDDQLEFGRL